MHDSIELTEKTGIPVKFRKSATKGYSEVLAGILPFFFVNKN